MTEADAELFRRKWEVSGNTSMKPTRTRDPDSRQYYFTYSEAGFATKTLGDVIITVGREGAMEMLEDIVL